MKLFNLIYKDIFLFISDMTHVDTLKAFCLGIQPKLDEISDSQSEACNTEPRTEEIHYPIIQRRKGKIAPVNSSSCFPDSITIIKHKSNQRDCDNNGDNPKPSIIISKSNNSPAPKIYKNNRYDGAKGSQISHGRHIIGGG